MVAALRGGVSVEGCALAGGRGWVTLAVSHGVYSCTSVEQFHCAQDYLRRPRIFGRRGGFQNQPNKQVSGGWYAFAQR